MAKLAKVARKVKRVVKTAAKVASAMSGLDAHAAKAATMLMDPCNAAISAACYRGDQGYKTRFVSNATFGGGAGITCVGVAFSPVQNIYWTIEVAGTATATAWSNRSGPGVPFLTANASAVRSLGACLSVTPVSANLAVAGQVYTTICPRSAINTASTATPDGLLSLCNKYGKIPIDQPIETKWLPAGSDEDYTVPGVDGDNSDSNIILMVFVGLPAASGVVVRTTNIVEWKPLASLGIVSESYKGNPSVNTIEHVKQALDKKDPNWWSNVGKTAFSVIRGYTTGGMVGAAGAAMRGVKNFA